MQWVGLLICSVFNDDGSINANGGEYEDMMRFDARVAIEKKLKDSEELAGIANNVAVSANGSSSTYYIMVFIKNLTSAQTDKGAFSGTVTAISTTGSQVKANFG